MATKSSTFRKGQSGNPAGRPPGSRNRTTLALDILLDGEAENITRKAVEMAKDGDTTAMRLCLERLLPIRKDRPITFAMPNLETSDDLSKATLALLTAVSEGELTPSEAGDIVKLVEAHRQSLRASEVEERMRAIEAKLEGMR